MTLPDAQPPQAAPAPEIDDSLTAAAPEAQAQPDNGILDSVDMPNAAPKPNVLPAAAPNDQPAQDALSSVAEPSAGPPLGHPWVPNYTVAPNGGITVGHFDVPEYAQILQQSSNPAEVAIGQGLASGKISGTQFADQANFDQENYQRYTAGTTPDSLNAQDPHDRDYFGWLQDRGLLPKQDGPGFFSMLGQTAKSLVAGAVELGKGFGIENNPLLRLSSDPNVAQAVQDADARGGAEVDEGAEQVKSSYQFMTAGLAERLQKAGAFPEWESVDDPTVQAAARQQILGAQLQHYQRVNQIGQQTSQVHDALASVAEQAGASPQAFDGAALAVAFMGDPMNIVAPAALKSLGDVLGLVGNKPMLGITEGYRLKAAQLSATQADLQSQIARYSVLGSDEAAARVESLQDALTQNGYELQTAKFGLDKATSDVNSWLQQFAPNRPVGNALAAAGGAVEDLGAGLAGLNQKVVDAATTLGKGDKQATSLLTKAAEKIAPTALAGGAIGYVASGGDKEDAAEGAVIGAAAPAVIATAGRWARIVGETYSLGQSTIPFLQRLAMNEDATGLESWIARKIDPFEGFQPGGNLAGNVFAFSKRAALAGVQGATNFAAGAVTSGAVGAGIGQLASGGDSNGASQGAAMAVAAHLSPWAIIGGFYNAYRPAYSADDLIAQRVGNLALLKQKWSGDPASLERLGMMTPEQQLDFAYYSAANPDFNLLLANRPADVNQIKLDSAIQGQQVPDLTNTPGFRYKDPATGRSTIVLNPADPNPGNWLGTVFAHEFWHSAQANGLEDPIVRATVGDSELGLPGIYTQIGQDGKPVLNPDGSFATTPEFQQAKQTYQGRVRQVTGQQDYTIDDNGFALEYAADAGADFLRNQNDELYRPSLGGMVREALGGNLFTRNVLAKLGVPFTVDGAVKGTLNIPGLRHSPEVTSLTQDYARSWAAGDTETQLPENADLVKVGRDAILKNPSLLNTLFGSSSDINWGKNGLPEGVEFHNGQLVVTDEGKLFKSAKQIAQDQAAMTAAVQEAVDSTQATENDPKAVKGAVVDGEKVYQGQYLSDAAVKAVEASGKLNPLQLEQLKNINALTKAGQGDPIRMFYQPATKTGRKYLSLAGHWRTEVPYSWHITKADNITFRTVSPDKVVANLKNLWKQDPERATTLWASQASMQADGQKYLQNLSQGAPGASGLSDAKRDFLNLALGINTSDRADVNPLYGSQAKKLTSFITSRRIDRTNRVTPAEGNNLPWSYEAYKRGRLNLTPGAAGDSKGTTLDQSPAGAGSGHQGDMAEDIHFTPGRDANPTTQFVASHYMEVHGISSEPHSNYDELPEARIRAIADHFESEAQHDPSDPAVQKSYKALISQTKAQYQAMLDAGVKIEPWTGKGEPYPNSSAMMQDVRWNKHLWFLPTENNFGSGSDGGLSQKHSGVPDNNIVAQHPMLTPSGVTIDGHPLLANDLFRAVHDYFGHTQQGYQFGPRGEFNAWKSHSRMFTPEAQGALAAETLAQNAWVKDRQKAVLASMQRARDQGARP